MQREIFFSLASFGGRNFFEAIAQATQGDQFARIIGKLSTQKIQLCPQSRGVLDASAAACLKSTYPEIEFRLHANIKIQASRAIFDAVDFDHKSLAAHWMQIKEISNLLSAPCYTLHAGLRKNGQLEEMFSRVNRLQDYLGIPVAVEGHYPTKNRDYLLDSWSEHKKLLASDVNFVIDLSHFNIIAAKEKEIHKEMLLELLGSPRCIEVHLSGNDNHRDKHEQLNGREWWIPMLEYVNPESTIFFEGAIS